MSHLAPCPSCNRHVRVSDAACPFCGTVVVTAAADVASPGGMRGRLGRAALFAAGATLMGLSACSDPKCLECTAGVAGMSGGGAGGGGGGGGSSGGAGADGGMDAVVSPNDGPVAIYSAVFPPPEPVDPAAFVHAKSGKPTSRS